MPNYFAIVGIAATVALASGCTPPPAGSPQSDEEMSERAMLDQQDEVRDALSNDGRGGRR